MGFLNISMVIFAIVDNGQPVYIVWVCALFQRQAMNMFPPAV